MNYELLIYSMREREKAEKAQLILTSFLSKTNLCGEIFSHILEGKDFLFEKYSVLGQERYSDVPNMQIIDNLDGTNGDLVNLYEDSSNNTYITYVTTEIKVWKELITIVLEKISSFRVNRELSDLSKPEAKKVVEWQINQNKKLTLKYEKSELDENLNVITFIYQPQCPKVENLPRQSHTDVNIPSTKLNADIEIYHKLLPFPFVTLDNCIERFREYFTTGMGKELSEYNKICSKVKDSKKVKELIGNTVINKMPPHHTDLIYIAQLMFIFKYLDFRATALISLLILKYWNENANSTYNIATMQMVNNIANNVLSELSKKI